MDLAKYIDHTLLSSAATADDIKKLCEEAIKYGFYAVCVQPFQVKNAAEFLKNSSVKIAAVVGFPHGATFTKIKADETRLCLKNGATEIDMVINIGALKEGDFELVEQDIKTLADLCKEFNAKLKVIIETGLLSYEEKLSACRIAAEAGADFVKTSTGVLKESKPATPEDVEIMYHAVNDFGVLVKASGGIKDKATAMALIEAGASRIGTSSGVSIVS